MAKSKCEICKCLNLLDEGKKHLFSCTWYILLRKYQKIKAKDITNTFCNNHRNPMILSNDIKSVSRFIDKAQQLWIDIFND